MKKTLIKEERVRELIHKCAKCGACRSVCPLYEMDQMETAIARGKIEIIKRDLAGDLTEGTGKIIRSFLDNCLLCGRCEIRCPNQVKTVELFSNARAKHAGSASNIIGKKGVIKAFGFTPQAFKAVSFLGRGILEVLAEKIPSKSGIFYKLPSLIGLSPRMVPEIPSYSFLEKKGVKADEIIDSRADLLFTGCVYNYLYPHILEKTWQSFGNEKNVAAPFDQACCGLPALGAGDMKSALENGKTNLGMFTKIQGGKIIFPCASCLYMVKKVYPELFDGTDLHEMSLEVSERCVDYESYLFDLAVQDLKPSASWKGEIISYHRPCHLLSIPGAIDRVESLLHGIFGDQFRIMEEADTCCGFGGTFNLVHHDKSMEMSRVRMEIAENAEIDILATSCSGCVNQLKESAARAGSTIRVVHVAELFDCEYD